ALEELTQVKAELAALDATLPALEERVKRFVLRAPVKGIINQVFVPNAGGVVGSGQELLEIVPVDEKLLVEAFVKPADIAFLYPGQPVNTKVTAYDFSRYGALDGHISRIGASVAKHPERDENVFFVEVITSSELLDADQQALVIVPGMVAEVVFLSDRKTVLDYIVKPVMRVRERAFRD
ncbi:MAG: HlyD family efflux transporter periplasmic adaptor subunit, partial [Pseudomonadota bacterium]